MPRTPGRLRRTTELQGLIVRPDPRRRRRQPTAPRQPSPAVAPPSPGRTPLRGARSPAQNRVVELRNIERIYARPAPSTFDFTPFRPVPQGIRKRLQKTAHRPALQAFSPDTTAIEASASRNFLMPRGTSSYKTAISPSPVVSAQSVLSVGQLSADVSRHRLVSSSSSSSRVTQHRSFAEVAGGSPPPSPPTPSYNDVFPPLPSPHSDVQRRLVEYTDSSDTDTEASSVRQTSSPGQVAPSTARSPSERSTSPTSVSTARSFSTTSASRARSPSPDRHRVDASLEEYRLQGPLLNTSRRRYETDGLDTKRSPPQGLQIPRGIAIGSAPWQHLSPQPKTSNSTGTRTARSMARTTSSRTARTASPRSPSTARSFSPSSYQASSVRQTSSPGQVAPSTARSPSERSTSPTSVSTARSFSTTSASRARSPSPDRHRGAAVPIAAPLRLPNHSRFAPAKDVRRNAPEAAYPGWDLSYFIACQAIRTYFLPKLVFASNPPLLQGVDSSEFSNRVCLHNCHRNFGNHIAVLTTQNVEITHGPGKFVYELADVNRRFCKCSAGYDVPMSVESIWKVGLSTATCPTCCTDSSNADVVFRALQVPRVYLGTLSDLGSNENVISLSPPVLLSSLDTPTQIQVKNKKNYEVEVVVRSRNHSVKPLTLSLGGGHVADVLFQRIHLPTRESYDAVIFVVNDCGQISEYSAMLTAP